MGLTNFLKKKLEGDPQEREMRKRRELALKRESEQAKWEGKRKGTIERARSEGYRQGKQGGGGIMGGLAEIGAHIDPTGGFGSGDFGVNPAGNPFGGPSTHRKRASSRSGGKGKGTTIKVNGTTITVHNRQKNRQHHRRRRESEFPF